MKPISNPSDVPKSEKIREPNSKYPTPDMDAKSPDFNSQNKKTEGLATDDKRIEEKQAPDVDETVAP